MILTADEIYDRLVNDISTFTAKAPIAFAMGDTSITVRRPDTIEAIMQEWLEGWLKKNGIEYALNDNTQMPPDFYLNPDDRKEGLMEIKAFNYRSSPGFDIADFRMYEREIAQKPWMLNVTYLIFGYDMSEDGVVTIKKIWKEKVWEMSRPMESGRANNKKIWPINLQIKDGTVHKIRPGKWYSKSPKFSFFENIEDFIAAVEETVYLNKDTRDEGPGWLQTIIRNYENYYGVSLQIPRWSDIKSKYVNTNSVR